MSGDEVVSFWIGQCGIQIGDAVWELFCLEHELNPEGKFPKGKIPDDTSYSHFFQETQDEQFVPRCVFVDLEPNVIDEIRTGIYRNLFHPEYMVDSMEDASSNFARGFYKCGKMILKQMIEATRKVVEACGKVQAFVLNHSFGGGTGSGFSSLLLEYLSIEFEKYQKAQIGVFPSPKMSTSVVEPYNAVLSIQVSMDISDLSMFTDNESMYEICCNKLSIEQPVFTNLNRLLAQVFSGLTASFRFEGSMTARLVDLQTNLVPYPRIHFPLLSFAPLESQSKALHETLSTREITQSVFQRSNQLLSVHPDEGIYMAVANLFRGDVTPIEINNAIIQLKKTKKLQFVQWCPTGFKTSLNYQPMTVVPSSGMAYSIRSLTNLINTTATKHTMGDLRFKFTSIYSRRAFIHWYVCEGLEESEFHDAHVEVVTLERDLLELESLEGEGAIALSTLAKLKDSSQKLWKHYNADNMTSDKPLHPPNPTNVRNVEPQESKEAFGLSNTFSKLKDNTEKLLNYYYPSNMKYDHTDHPQNLTNIRNKDIQEKNPIKLQVSNQKKLKSYGRDNKSPGEPNYSKNVDIIPNLGEMATVLNGTFTKIKDSTQKLWKFYGTDKIESDQRNDPQNRTKTRNISGTALHEKRTSSGNKLVSPKVSRKTKKSSNKVQEMIQKQHALLKGFSEESELPESISPKEMIQMQFTLPKESQATEKLSNKSQDLVKTHNKLSKDSQNTKKISKKTQEVVKKEHVSLKDLREETKLPNRTSAEMIQLRPNPLKDLSNSPSNIESREVLSSRFTISKVSSEQNERLSISRKVVKPQHSPTEIFSKESEFSEKEMVKAQYRSPKDLSEDSERSRSFTGQELVKGHDRASKDLSEDNERSSTMSQIVKRWKQSSEEITEKGEIPRLFTRQEIVKGHYRSSEDSTKESELSRTFTEQDILKRNYRSSEDSTEESEMSKAFTGQEIVKGHFKSSQDSIEESDRSRSIIRKEEEEIKPKTKLLKIIEKFDKKFSASAISETNNSESSEMSLSELSSPSDFSIGMFNRQNSSNYVRKSVNNLNNMCSIESSKYLLQNIDHKLQTNHSMINLNFNVETETTFSLNTTQFESDDDENDKSYSSSWTSYQFEETATTDMATTADYNDETLIETSVTFTKTSTEYFTLGHQKFI